MIVHYIQIIMNYSLVSRELTRSLSKDDKKSQGIYFTPPVTVTNILKYIKDIVSGTNLQILEPSCGSGEFLRYIRADYPESEITGIEKNKTIFDAIDDFKTDNLSILNEDYLKYEVSTKYDLIIGNPPYFVLKKKDVDKKYHKYFEGRPNIFNLFIVKALGELNENGILCFVLPKSFLNCLYYNKTRQFIYEQYEIVNIMNCDDESYLETKQDTFALVLRNSTNHNNNNRFSFKQGEYIVFGEERNINEIIDLKQNSRTLSDSGFDVRVGNVVWNQCKDKLTDDSSKTRLIYSSDIVDHKLTQKSYKDEKKKNYIDKKGESKPCLVVNRGYGAGKYDFQYCLIEGGFEYLVENHLICIVDTIGRSDEELINDYKKIVESLEDSRTKRFIELYFGNCAVNTTELKCIMPIY